MGSNVQLSAEELRLVTDPAWILTKNSIIRKVVEMFGELSGEWRGLLAAGSGYPGAWSELSAAETEPKISKGEQHKGLPWVMLDYPRVFGKEDVMAVRTMFWWGHCFSVTLHVKGKYLRLYMPVILLRRVELERAGFEVGIAADEWEHEHTAATMGTWEAMDAIGERPFLKLSARCELDRWNEAPEILTEKFAVLVRVLNSTGGQGY